MKKWFKDKAGIAEDYVQSGVSDDYRKGHENIFGKTKFAAVEPSEAPDLSIALSKIHTWWCNGGTSHNFPKLALQDAMRAAADYKRRTK